jgi:ESS family glutamate:Na+ symporter
MYWSTIDDVVYILLFFALAMVLKRFIPGLRKFIIPNSILAGFIGFIIGPNVLNLVQFDIENLGRMIYHLTAIGFIALSLRKTAMKKRNLQYVNTGMIIVSTYLFQGILGFSMFWLWNLGQSDVLPIIGFLIPMGYGQGPGQAFSIGSQWENLGLQNGGAVGLLIAAAGFAWATIGGIFILNFILKVKKKETAVQFVEKKVVQVQDYEFSDIDGLTVQLVIIVFVYMIVYGLLFLLNRFVFDLFPLGKTFGSVLWGFHFAFGAATALLFRRVYEKCHSKGIVHENYLNDFLLHRIAGGVFDFMVAASISAIDIRKISGVLLSIFVICFVIGILTYVFVSWLVRKTMKEKKIENTLALFGNLTGTISTGMALLREVDPGLESGASDNLVFGSGIAIFVGLPMLLVLSLPPFVLSTGNPIYYWYALGLMLLFFIGMLLFWFRPLMKKNKP